MKLHSARHGAHVTRERRVRLFAARTAATARRAVAAYAPELLLVVGLLLVVWAITWWSTPIAVLAAGAACMLLAWLAAVSSRGT